MFVADNSAANNAAINDTVGAALDWDSSIKDTGSVYDIVPEGEYSFAVKDFRRDWFEGSEKLPPCPMAILKLELTNPEGKRYIVTTDLKLCEKLEPVLLSPFFRSIGLLDAGGEVVMDWNDVPGAVGRVKVTLRDYVDSAGAKRQGNGYKYLPYNDGDVYDG